MTKGGKIALRIGMDGCSNSKPESQRIGDEVTLRKTLELVGIRGPNLETLAACRDLSAKDVLDLVRSAKGRKLDNPPAYYARALAGKAGVQLTARVRPKTPEQQRAEHIEQLRRWRNPVEKDDSMAGTFRAKFDTLRADEQESEDQ